MSSGVRTLNGLGGRLLTERPGRAALTIAGVVLGVAMFTGSLLTSITARSGFDDFAREINGQADVVATPPGGSLNTINNPGGGVLDGSTVETLELLPGVEHAVGLLSAPISFTGPSGETSQRINERVTAAIVGADLDDAGSVFEVEVESGRLPTAVADEIVLPKRVAEHVGADIGDSLTIATEHGPRRLLVVGVLANRGIGRLDRIGFTSLEALRRITAQPEVLTQVALRLESGVDGRDWVAEHESAVPAGITISAANSTLDSFKGQVNALSGTVTAMGAGLLFTAGFLVYLTLAMSVTERTRLFGTMIALGATRRQIRRVVLAESLFVGIVGSVPGVAIGIALAIAMRAATGRLFQEFGNPGLTIVPWALALSVAVGVTTTVVSALVPAWRASRTDPTSAIRTTEADAPLRAGSAVTGVVVAGIGASVIALGGVALSVIGLVLVLIGTVRLVPHIVAPIASALAPLVSRLFRSGGRIAVQHLMTERTRSAYTLALVMVVMAMTIMMAAGSSSFNKSLERQLTAQLGDDLTVTGASTLPPEFVEAVHDVQGVGGVTTRTVSSSSFTTSTSSEDVRIWGIDPDTYFDVANFPFVDGSADALLDELGSSDAVLMGDATARRLRLRVGDSIVLETLQGPKEFHIAATAQLIDIPAAFVTSQALAEQAFGSQGAQEILVRVQPEFSPQQVSEYIQTQLGDRTTFIVSTASELKADVRAQVGSGINSFYVLLLLAGVVGTFGLANTMAVSVTKRYREIGVLRAIGARRRHIRDMAIAEALTLVTIAFVLAVPLGLALSKPVVDVTVEQFRDLTIDYSIPWTILPILLLVGVITAVGSALWPARRAVHVDIDEALRFE